MRHIKLSCIQTCTGEDKRQNLDKVLPALAAAAEQGAHFITLPETSNFMVQGADKIAERICAEEDDLFVRGLCDAAHQYGVMVLAGSVFVQSKDKRAANRSLLIGADGLVKARYDKIHLFDVTLASGERHRESQRFRPGEKATLYKSAMANIGLTICYDLRFPHLFRRLAQAGADIITVPSAFTRPTGEAHWHVLLRARAIETGCFIVAPAQSGIHENGRATYGHSLVVNPWGEILVNAQNQPNIGDVELISVDVNLDAVDSARSQIPALTHDRDFDLDILS